MQDLLVVEQRNGQDDVLPYFLVKESSLFFSPLFLASDEAFLLLSHSYACITKHLQTHRTCPVCRSSLDPSRIIPMNSNDDDDAEMPLAVAGWSTSGPANVNVGLEMLQKVLAGDAGNLSAKGETKSERSDDDPKIGEISPWEA